MRTYNFIDNIYIPSGEAFFDYSDGDAVEDYLLDHFREATDLSTGSAGLASLIRDWPTLYHLSPRRADLLRPLESLLKGRRVLEIGCGCGALTRFLGELGCEVVALEGSKRRALITRTRCRDLDNVRVVCDNFSSFEGEGQFDIVLLVGVLEYSQQFIKGQNPPLDMLRRAKEYLSPDGRLILAIENRMGLKYWAGAPEDHTGQPFDGIEDKYTSRTAVTFGRVQLQGLLSDAGFGSREFLYPFPDYKLPEVIVREEAFSTQGLCLRDLLHEKYDYTHGSGQATEFSTTRAAGSVLDNGLMQDLANSFLVVAGGADVADRATAAGVDNVLVYSYNSTRQKPYCKSNLFVRGADGIRVIRHRLYPEAPYPSDAPVTHKILDEDYIQGRLLAVDAHSIVTREGWTLEELGEWARRYYKILLDTASGERGALAGDCLDLTPFNILITDRGQALPFDQEWQCPETIPIHFILFRGLVYCLDKVSMYSTPAAGTPTGLIPLVKALINLFLPFDAAEFEECIRLEEKYFGAVPLMPGQPFAHGSIALKKDWKTQYQAASQELQDLRQELQQAREAYQVQLAAAQANLEKTAREHMLQATRILQDHQAHAGLLQQHIDWYRRSYEERSLPGVLLQRRLAAARTQQKYLTAFLLGTMQERGAGKTLSLIAKTIFSKGWKGLRDPRAALMPLMRTPVPVPVAAPNTFLYDEGDPARALEEITAFTRNPKISLIMPVYNTDPRWLEKAVNSIRGQWYEHWQLCIADDGSTQRGTQQLLRQLEKEDKIKVIRLAKNAGISAASNAALQAADGDYIALVDHDDEITPNALYEVVRDLNVRGDADILYSDECKVDEEGHLSEPFYKPAYSAELLLNMMYPGHLTVYKKRFLLEKVGLFRSEYDLSQDYDLMLRAVEKTTKIRHIEKILYHWRLTAGSSSQGEKPHARTTNLAALADAMKRRNVSADILGLPTANRAKLHWKDQPLVSIIIPTDSRANLQDTLESIYTRTDYPRLEVVVVTNSKLIADAPPSSAVYVPYDKPYNFSDKCNAGAADAHGEILIFFNDDVRPLQSDWLENTIELLFIPGVGGVSPKLIYEDDSIQYAGMATGVRGLTGTTFHGYAKASTAYINFPQSVRNVSILSGACMAMRKEVFEELGGFDAVNTPSAHSDVDLSFKILDSGRRCVYTPYATLRHIGHLSLREYDESPAARAKDKSDIYLLRRWTDRIATDPYFTGAMRDYLYHDSPEPYRIYAPAGRPADGASESVRGDVLLISHDLSLSGAPIMLLQLCKLLIRNGYFVVVACESNGPAGKLFLEAGAPLIIDSLLLRQHASFTRFARNFDHVVCNTAVTWTVVQQLSHLTHTLWWLHEAKVLEAFVQEAGFITTLTQAKEVIAPSDYALQHIKRYNVRAEKIYYGYPDIRKNIPVVGQPPEGARKLIFSIIGSIEPRKGQDILLNALQQLDRDTKDGIEVWLVGRPHDLEYHKVLAAGTGSNVKIIGEADHERCLDLMRRSDVIVCPSRDDPFPVVIVEALCLSKPCIVSSNTGFAELMTDGVDGYVIPNEDSEVLASKIKAVVQHPATIPTMGAAARQLYQRYMGLAHFEEKFLSLLAPASRPESSRKSPTQKTLSWQD